MLPTSTEYFDTYFGILRGGGAPGADSGSGIETVQHCPHVAEASKI